MVESNQDRDGVLDVLAAEAARIKDALGLDAVQIMARLTESDNNVTSHITGAGDVHIRMGLGFEWLANPILHGSRGTNESDWP